LDSNSNKNNNEKSPYEILGVKEGAAFEDIQKARDIKVKEAGEDLILKAKIESSFDQLLMGSLKARQSGNISYEAVSASKKEKQINQALWKEKQLFRLRSIHHCNLMITVLNKAWSTDHSRSKMIHNYF